MFDIGANLTSSHFSDDLDEVLNDSLAAGVEKFCITSSNALLVDSIHKFIVSQAIILLLELICSRTSSCKFG